MCWYCGEIIANPEPIGRSLRCDACGKDLRSCKNCRFFLPGSRGDCKETSAEPVSDKERANFCDWFSLDQKYRSKSTGQNATKVAATKAADEKGGLSKTADAAKTAFENLFK